MVATYSSVKQFLGVAKETTPGTPVAMTATLPVEKFEVEDKPVWLDDKAWRGSMVEQYGTVQGVIKTDWSASGPVFGDGIGYLLANVLGDLATTGASAPYTHAFSVLNTGAGQPVTHTLTHFQGVTATSGARQLPGACVSELTLKFNAESQLFTFDAKGASWPTVAAGATPTPNPSTVTPIASWRATLGIGGPATGGTQVKNVGEGEISIKRVLEPVYTAAGVQSPYIIQRGPVTVTGKLKFVVADESPLTTMLSNTQPQLQLVVSNGQTGAAQVAVQIDCQQAAYKTAKIDSGKAAIAYDVDFEAIANTSNAGASGGYSPIKITLTNAVASGTYL